MYVEILKEQPPVKQEEVKQPAEPRMKPAPLTEPQKKKPYKGDFAVMGGIAMASFVPDSTSYSDSWNEGILKSVTESGTVTHKIDNPLGVGISFSYLFMGGLGIQARVDYNLTKKFIPEESLSDYTITWSWTSSGPYSIDETWPVTGEISVIPLSLNLIYKVQGGGIFVPYFSGGVSYFTGKLKANTYGGFGLTWTDSTSRYIDYLDIPVMIDASLSGIGFNVGGGIDLVLTPNIAISLEGIYFIGKTIEEYWAPVPGTYSGNNFPNVSWTIDQTFVDLIIEEMPTLEIKTSFLKLQAGIKFLF
jgi:opacity protein-like surface antigen